MSNKKLFFGQGIIEYALILALVAFVVIIALKIIEPSLGIVYSQISTQLGSL
jgi:Flp pilus assembly pilin Flp